MAPFFQTFPKSPGAACAAAFADRQMWRVADPFQRWVVGSLRAADKDQSEVVKSARQQLHIKNLHLKRPWS